jgi:ribosomal protein S6--L-glutamate ligase
MNLYIIGDETKVRERRLRDEAEKRGHKVTIVEPDSFAFHSSKDVTDITLGNEHNPKIDLCYLMCPAKVRKDWLALLKVLSKKGAAVVSPRNIDTHVSDLTSYTELSNQHFQGIPFPQTVHVCSTKMLSNIQHIFSLPVIVKQCGSSGGKGIILADTWSEVEEYIIGLNGKVAVMIREFIPNDGDIRVSVIDGKAVAAMYRTPKSGEFRANWHQGGRGTAINMKEETEIVELAERVVKMKQVDIAGVDIVRHKKTGELFVIEINPNPGFDYIEDITGISVAEKIIDMFERRANQ